MSQTTKQGTTHLPAILKKPVTAQEVFETLGFEKVNVDVLTKIGYEITAEDLDASFGDFAASVKQLGDYVDDYNSLKNRLKHGKAVFGLDFGLEQRGDIAHLQVAEEKAAESRGSNAYRSESSRFGLLLSSIWTSTKCVASSTSSEEKSNSSTRHG